MADESLAESDEKIVVQGIADCILFEPDGAVLVDYKTDRLRKPQDFIKRYESQLSVYRQALNRLFADLYPELDSPIRSAMIYSLYLGREILL
jgi:ATP-dependent helicase/nuclease subunit A